MAKAVEAVASLRTSYVTNVGADKLSEKRQRATIESFARRAEYDVVQEFSRCSSGSQQPREGFSPFLKMGGGGLEKAR